MEDKVTQTSILERGDDVLYICTDNGAYVNTGGQRSGATPACAATTIHPAGRLSVGKTEKNYRRWRIKISKCMD